MSVPHLTTYRVGITTWAAYRVHVEARDPEHARELAFQLWSTTEGIGPFKEVSTGVDDEALVESVDSGEGAS